MIMEMRLAEKPFALIASGEKTVEIRLNDEKRRQLIVGDIVIFVKMSDSSARITAQVTALKCFGSFSELFSSELFSQTGSGSMTVEQATESMYQYYTKEQEKMFGVLAITIKKCR